MPLSELNIQAIRDNLQALDFKALFNRLGWSRPVNPEAVAAAVQEVRYIRREIAQLSGVFILEVQIVEGDGKIPDAKLRRAIFQDIAPTYHENLLIFLDSIRTQSLWYWMKRDNGKSEPREHLYMQGQPGDLSLSKLEAMVFDMSAFEAEGVGSVLDVAKSLQNALDVERVTKRFFEDYKEKHTEFSESIRGIDDERDRRWYASILLHRLMFIYFLQRKRFVNDGHINYLQDKLQESNDAQPDQYYRIFLNLLFFEGFAKPEEERSEGARALLGKIRYLNGGLFLRHRIEQTWPNIFIPDEAFRSLFKLFGRYSWNLDDTPGGRDDEISPHILGYIFEKYINQKSFGAYYTRPQITEYLCDRSIYKLILEKINAQSIPGKTKGYQFDTVEELLLNLDAGLCRRLLIILPAIALLDPACGSGAFLVSAMNTLTKVYGAITGRIEYLHDTNLTKWLHDARAKHQSLNYYIRKKIIIENLFGVDIMDEATEIAKLCLFLALVASVQTVEQLEPLPNIDFNILSGNSLIGLLHVNEEAFDKQQQAIKQQSLFYTPYSELVAAKNRRIKEYRDASEYMEDLQALRDGIQEQRADALANLNELLLDEFKRLGIKYEEATWDDTKDSDGKTKKRTVHIQDIANLHPFHWGYEFDAVMERGGFDIIITNPPWEILKPQAKEFFATHSELVSKNTMRIEDFETERAKLLMDADTRTEWLAYQNGFPYQSAYFRTAPQYCNQISTVNGKKSGTDINLYKLFTEQCYNLLRPGGECGIVIPSGIYTDLGAKQLREMLFQQTQVTGLFCFENRKGIFENVDSRFKFVVLTFEKGGETHSFPSAFMRHNADELERFPKYGALETSVELIRRLSPNSLSIMEFKSAMDVQIAQKMLQFPLLGEKVADTWNVTLGNEFHMTNDSKLFRNEPGPGRLPLYEGKMIHQFTHQWSQPRYWVDEQEGRAAVLGRKPDTGQKLDYQDYRLGFRDIARNTDMRTLISTIIPSAFHGNKLPTVEPIDENGNPLLSDRQQLFLCAVWNSFTIDWVLRMKVTTTVNFFYIYQLPIPRLTEQGTVFRMLVERGARLICTTQEFQQLWESVFPGSSWSPAKAVSDATERAKLRAEIDGLVAHLYGLTEAEFVHVLSTFPLVEQSIKDAALDAYRVFALTAEELALTEMISNGETERVEFKVAACWNAFTRTKDESMKENVVREVAAFLNSRTGGTLLIGVEDNGNVVGLADDYIAANLQKRNRDGYMLFLMDAISSGLSGNWSLFCTITFGSCQGKEVCRIEVAPASGEIYLKKGDFYVREGARSRKYTTQEAMAYIKERWASLLGAMNCAQ